MPKGVAVDSRGNLFISDGGYLANASNNRIREVSGGIISTVAGGGTNSATAGSPALGVALSLPEGIITDSSGNVYFADSGTNTVNKVTFQSSHTSRT
jgi:sugar lactone lactonase YvrE